MPCAPSLRLQKVKATDASRPSISVRFRGSDGIIERPRRGARYQAL
jgi:hypothetical protein